MEWRELEIIYQRGVDLKESGDLAGAERCFRQIVAADPELPDPQHSLGVVLQMQGRLDEAVGHYCAAIAADPGFVQAYFNLANTYWRSARYGEALRSLETLLVLAPDHREGHWLHSMILLLTGDLANGWEEYEWRWGAQGGPPHYPELGRPLWTGEPLAGRTLLIHMEQGRGDMIQFIRYAPLVAAKGGRVVVAALPELLPVLAHMPGVALAVDRAGILPAFDLHLPVLSLPRVFGTTLASIPATTPYLAVDTAMVSHWAERMSAPSPALRVGLVWSGNEQPDANRSCPFSCLAPLFFLTGVEFYSLQLGRSSDAVPPPGAVAPLMDLTAGINDFGDTAALIRNLDLVICIDTAVAHLAGALDVPVWTLLPAVPDWRWLLERDDSPWYPSMRLFRQVAVGAWPEVIGRVVAELRRVLADAGFHNSRGVRLVREGQRERACHAFHRATMIRPEYAEAHCNLGVVLDGLGQSEAAVQAFTTALRFAPDSVQALFNLGNCRRTAGNLVGARFCYEQAVELAPEFIPARLGLAETLKEQKQPESALECLEQALRIAPDSAEVWHRTGELLQSMELLDRAITAYGNALSIEPGRSTARNMLGTVYHALGRLAEAEACYRQALAQRPGAVTVLNNLGTVLHAEGRVEEAGSVFQTLLASEPGNAEAHWNLALAYLSLGQYLEGWREYEWRFRKVNPVRERGYSQPRWDGSPLAGRTIFLHSEQGFGDTLQFARYIPLLAAGGGRVVLECQSPALQRLLLSLDGISDVVVEGAPLPPFDVYLPLLSLPLLLGTTVDTVPANIPYLHAARADVAQWCERLVATAAVCRVGLVWHGRQGQILNRKRSCPLELFKLLWKIPGVEFYSLQIGEGTEQLAELGADYPITDLTGQVHDFADSAALIANLDLVISIDTAVAHLAGAVGADCWTLLPYGPDWRWTHDRATTPWYPGMRLFRRKVAEGWEPVMENVATALAEFVAKTDLRKRSVDKESAPVQWPPVTDVREVLGKKPLLVGLAWSGRQDNPHNRKRTCPLHLLAPLFELSGVRFVSLQLGEDASVAAAGLPLITELADRIQDFEETAALMASLDLIVTIDTSVAHLAGATARPTWVLLAHVADWRWLESGGETPWYPGVRLFRQPRFGDWESVVHKVCCELAQLTGNVSWQSQTFNSPHQKVGQTDDEQHALEQELERLTQILADNPTDAAACLDVGAAQALLGRHDEAVRSFRKALELESENSAAHLNLAYTLLAQGEYHNGWRHLEWRLSRIKPDQLPPWPMLDRNNFGRHEAGTSLLVHCEQGFGDTIQFARFLPIVADAGYRVVVSCQPAMASLVRAIHGVDLVVPHGELLPECKLQVLMLSLAGILDYYPEATPDATPYLKPCDNKITEWKQMVEAVL